MSQALAALLGAFVGATAVIGSGIFAEMYRRHRDCQGIASALAGEIAGLIYMSKKRQYEQLFEQILSHLDLGNDVPVPKLVAQGSEYLDPVINRYLDRLGHLPGSLPERIVRFYQFISGIRVTMQRLAEEEFDIIIKAAMIREDLDLWRETVNLADQLVLELHNIAGTTLSARSSAFIRKHCDRLFSGVRSGSE